jgi:serine-type D-Ala-D-Ala carboxypeptidase (penicillin-binding protein 5/6)
MPCAATMAARSAVRNRYNDELFPLPMRPRPFLAAFFAAALAVSAPFHAQTLAATAPGAIPAPSVAATAHLLVDVTSGQTLEAVNADQRRDPASLTKLMTAYLVFGALRAKSIQPSQMVNVSERAWRAEGSRMFIEPKRAVSVDELLRGMIIQSGNDASIALAELSGGSEDAFVARMNAEATRLGMANTHFANVTGLSAPEHYSTAADLAKLASAVINDYPEFYPLYAQKEFRYNNISQQNRNRLLWTDPNVDGVKTGHTEAAGWCLIASAKHGERRVLAVVLGAASDAARASEAQKLLNWGLQAFDTVQLYQSGKTISTLRVWKGTRNDVPAGFLADRYVTLQKGKADKLSLTMEAQETLVAPIARAQRVGTVKVALEGVPVGEFPLIALEEVPAAGFIGRAWDTIRLWFKRA